MIALERARQSLELLWGATSLGGPAKFEARQALFLFFFEVFFRYIHPSLMP